MRRLALILVTLALLVAAPGAGFAQIGPLPPAPPQTPPPAPGPTVTDDDDGLSTRQMLLIAAAAAGLIGVIGWVIVRDAKRAAPAPQRGTAEAARKPSSREREQVKRQRRDKGKAARQQRKRNRPR